MKVFIVTSGQYCDYGINAVFSTKELAEKYISAFDNEYIQRDIEEWDLDPNKTDLNQNRRAYFLRINKNGDIGELYIADSSYGYGEDISKSKQSYTSDKAWLNIFCFADDENHAIKIAGKKRSQILAANLWGE